MISREENSKRELPSPLLGLACLGGITFLVYSVGTFLQRRNLSWGLLITELGCVLLPLLLIGQWRRWNYKIILKLQHVTLIEMFRSIIITIISVAAIVVGQGMFVLFFQGYGQGVFPISQYFMMDTVTSKLVTLVIFVLVPAFCEEALFRGLLQSSLECLGQRKAFIYAAVLFSLWHGSICRLLPTFFLGLSSGYLCYRYRSIYPAVLNHLLHNLVPFLFL